MKYLVKILGGITLMSMMLILTGCPCKDCEPVKEQKPENKLFFKAIILNESEETSVTADSNHGNVTLNWTMNITVNGESTSISGTRKGNELPVIAGNELEIIFIPSCPEETEANFMLPDGKSQKVTAESPSFKWIVPENFKSGDQIIGQSEYETEEFIIKQHGEITLIAIE